MDTKNLVCRAAFAPGGRDGIDDFLLRKAHEYFNKWGCSSCKDAFVGVLHGIYSHSEWRDATLPTRYAREIFYETFLDRTRFVPWEFVRLIAQYYDISTAGVVAFAEKKEVAFQKLLDQEVALCRAEEEAYQKERERMEPVLKMMRKHPFHLSPLADLQVIFKENSAYGQLFACRQAYTYGVIAGKRAERAKKKGRSDAATSRTEPISNSNYTPT